MVSDEGSRGRGNEEAAELASLAWLVTFAESGEGAEIGPIAPLVDSGGAEVPADCSSSARNPSSSTSSLVVLRMKARVESSRSPCCRSFSTRERAGMRIAS